ncbi:MAG: hypothetical protein PGN29_19335 [Gordonia paraffinivorans]
MPDVTLRSHTRLSAHPVTATARAPLGLPVADLRPALTSGHRLVDVRPQRDRDVDGVVAGAIALAPEVAVARLTPGTHTSLRFAEPSSLWVLVGTDGHDAEWLTWHLHAAGVTGARFLLGGARALRTGPIGTLPTTAAQRREVASITAH